MNIKGYNTDGIGFVKSILDKGYDLKNKLVNDIERGLVGKICKFAVITDTNVADLYAKPISEKLVRAGYQVDMFVFAAGEKSKTRETKARIEDAMLEKGYRRDWCRATRCCTCYCCCILWT